VTFGPPDQRSSNLEKAGTTLAGLWRHAGLMHRIGLSVIGLGMVVFVLAGVLLMMNMGWWIAITYMTAFLLVAAGNGLRVRAVKRYMRR
jgi:hypothetical protein